MVAAAAAEGQSRVLMNAGRADGETGASGTGGCSTVTGPRSAAGTGSPGFALSDFARAESSGVIS